MSLLQDLEALDLTAILDARASITVSINGEEMQGLLRGGAAQAVLGDLGATIAQVRGALDEPAALIDPLVKAVAALPIDLEGIDISRYLAAVQEGTAVLVRLFADFDGDPASIGRSLGMSLSEVLDRASSILGDVVQIDTGDLSNVRRLIDRVERGVPTDAADFADLAIDVLVPFPQVKGQLRALAPDVSALIERAGAISLPPTRAGQLVAALDAVATAAITGELPAVQAALRQVEAVRLNTRTAIETDLVRAAQLIDGLGIDAALSAVRDLNGAVGEARAGVLDFLDDLRADLASLRAGIESIDAAELMTYLSGLLDVLETQLRTHIADAVDVQVERLKAWLRDLLRHLPIRQLRAELTRFIDAAAQAIRDADLDRYAREVYALLEDLRSRVGALDLGDQVRGALEGIGNQIGDTLQTVTDALGAITGAIDALADTARDGLQRLVDALSGFKATIDALADAVNNLGIEAAAQQVIETLATLRETAEDLLADAPLPEPMRPLVGQLVETLKGVDVSAAFEPIRAAANELKLPAEVEDTIRTGLDKAKELLDNLIPAELIQSITDEITAALDEIRKFDPSSLLSGVTDFINQTAAFIEGLDPTPHVASVRAPFQAVLDTLDKAHPARLLAPVIEAYNDLYGAVHIPPPQEAARNIGQAVGSVGESAARAVVEPVQQVAPGTAVRTGGGTSPVPRESISLEGAKPGDIIRLLGYLPNKLRQTLARLDAGAAGNVLSQLDALMSGLAANLRRVPEALYALDARIADELDALLLPLGAAQLRAQIALRGQASFSAGGASASFDLNGALAIIAAAGPGAMRASLTNPIITTRGRAQAAISRTGGDLGVDLDRAARLLEEASITRVLGNVDAFLAALDPEPIAAELDALVIAVVNKTPALFDAVADPLKALIARVKRIIEEFNPAAQASKFLTVLDVLREELDVLNPARLAAELAEVHAAIRATIAAYDPLHLAAGIKAILDEIASELRSLNPAEMLLGDLTFLDDIVDRVEAAIPLNALEGVGESLQEVGAELAALDPGALIAAVNGLPERVVSELERAIQAIKQELITLLELLQYFSAQAEVSVEVGR